MVPHTEFSYNYSRNRSTTKTPFKVAYRLKTQQLLGLVPLSHEAKASTDRNAFAEHIWWIHERDRATLKNNNEASSSAANQHNRVKEFKKEDFILVHLRQGCFPQVLIESQVTKIRAMSGIEENKL